MFGPLVIAYLFLGGAGAGACVVVSIVGLLVPSAELASSETQRIEAPGEYRRLLVPVLAVAAAAVIVGVFCLLADLGNAQAALGVFAAGVASWANVGVVALVACVAVSLLQLALLELVPGALLLTLRLLQTLGVVFGFLAAAYTGLLLMDMSGVPLWSTPWLAVLFALSACSCGFAIFAASAVLSGAWDYFAGALARFAAADMALVALEGIALACFVLLRDGGDGVAAAAVASSVSELLTGDLSVAFWMGAVFAGLVVPFASEVLMVHFDETPAYHLCAHVLVTAAFALAGALCLRYCVVMAGAHPYLGLLGVAAQL